MSTNPSHPEPKNVGSIISASNYVAGSTAATGAIFGAAYATLKSRPVVLWTVIAGGQCGVLGWTFWATRSLMLQSIHQQDDSQPISTRQELMYSTVAGSLSGMVGGAFRGRANVLPGAIAMGLVGLGGQASYNALSLTAWTDQQKRPLLDRLSESKWWPLKALSDEEYEKDLTEQLTAIEAEMSMIEDTINQLKQNPHSSHGEP